MASTPDFSQHSGPLPDGSTPREDSPTDASSKAQPSSPEDILLGDWSQWMRWDETDIDHVPGNVDSHDALMRNTEPTVAPSDLSCPMVKPDFTFQGSLASSHHRETSNTSLDFSPIQQSLSPTSSFPGRPIQSTSQTISGDNVWNQYPSQQQEQQYQRFTGHYSPNTMNADPLSHLSTSPSTRKRKIASDGDTCIEGVAGKTSTPAPEAVPTKKRSHNVIEKRYRANLNDKIADLRDCVPSLRVAHKERNSGTANRDGGEDGEGVTAGNKLNKASILSKATEYIRHLEARNTRLDEENMALKNRLRQLDKVQEQGIMTSTSISGSNPSGCTTSSDSLTGQSPGVHSHTEGTSHENSPNPLYPPEGLIKVPESFRRMRNASKPQPHYADSFTSHRPSNNDNSSSDRNGRSNRTINKFMLGSLAGLMIVGGLENHKKEDSSEKGLLSVPFHALGQAYDLSRKYLYVIRATPWHIRALSQFAMTSLLLVACAFFVFLYLFYSRPRQSRDTSKEQTARSTSAAITPAEFRREAWLTSIQTVPVPRHTFFPEWFAVTSRCLEYCLRCLFGWRLYSWITGISEEDEKGRVKAWDIALDAQLTGGDAEATKSRLVLTIFASGTLPPSPARCMIKAIHVRILLWRVGAPQSITCETSNNAALMLAQYQWQLAQTMQKTLPEDHEDSLPSHLAFLLTMDCEDVLTDGVVQRASNMIWNRPTQEATEGDALLDVIVQDTAVRSPLDALAAWRSSIALQDALTHSFIPDLADRNVQRRKGFEAQLDLALKSAPVTSTAYTRAAVIKAVFCDQDRVANVNSVLSALPRPKRKASNNTIFVDSSLPISARAETSTAVRCAMIAAILKGQTEDNSVSGTSGLTLENAIRIFNKLSVDPVELTLLGFASLYHLLHIVATDERLIPASSLSSSFCSLSSGEVPPTETDVDRGHSESSLPIPDIARVACGLIYWVRNAYNPVSSGLTPDVVDDVVDDCVKACRNAGIDIDEAVLRETPESAKSSEPLSEDQKKATADETPGDANHSNKSRRSSIRSADTGYGSLGTEDAIDETIAEKIPAPSLEDSSHRDSLLAYIRLLGEPADSPLPS